jgi:hypothetical protein
VPVLREGVLEQIRGLRGLVATCVTTGTVDPDYASAREEMRAWNIEHGLTNVEYRTFNCVLVEAGRDAVVAHTLAEGYDYVLQIDADAAPFPPSALAQLLARAFVQYPESDAFGAYCQLKQPPYLPTIDTGTGTWEVRYPGEGVLPAIRTGGHFLLTKRSAFERIGEGPYFRTRHAMRAIDVLAELDNFARTHLDGENPFAETPDWETLVQAAKRAGGAGPGSVGEDSGFCDRLLAAGGKLFVDTDLVAGHMTRTLVTPSMLKEAIGARERAIRAACGVLA